MSSPPAEKASPLVKEELPSSNTSVTVADQPESSTTESTKPASFSSLFRYATRFEIFLDLIGAAAACAAGTGQALLFLAFKGLVDTFNEFAIATSTPTSPDALAAAQDNLRREAQEATLYLVYIGIGVFASTFVYMQTWVYTGEQITRRVRENYLAAVLRQDIAYFDKYGSGEIATRISTDCQLFQDGISQKFPVVIMLFATFISGFILAFTQQWLMTLVLFSIVPAISITGWAFGVFNEKYTSAALAATAEGASFAEEIISTVRVAHAFGTRSKLEKVYEAFNLRAKKQDTLLATVNGICIGIFYFVNYATYALAFYYGTTLILQDKATGGTVIAVFFAVLIGSFSLGFIAPNAQVITKGMAAAAKLYETIDRVPPIDSSSEEGLKPDTTIGEITFENVAFHYPTRATVPILEDFSLTFESGKTTALVGPSGSGKSTIVALVQRLYDPKEGTVKLDGRRITDLNIRWLRSQIGVVSQEPTLFAVSVYENVAFGLIGSPFENEDEDSKRKRIVEACKLANADGFISKLPLGYDTLVGERGLLLSGGQKQRVCIARAIVSDPKILLLDEATSALDVNSEAVVQDALNKASKNRTTISIAHRLSTIKDADKIVVMRAGEIVESGTHDELLSIERGLYAGLVSAQKIAKSAHGPDEDDAESGKVDAQEIAEEVPLGLERRATGRSIGSEILEKRQAELDAKEPRRYGIIEMFRRIGALEETVPKIYSIGTISAIIYGAIYPVVAIVFGFGIQIFQKQGQELRDDGNRFALYFFIISLVAGLSQLVEIWAFSLGVARIAFKIRRAMLSTILKQDITFFDKKENASGSLTASLADNAAKVGGLAGLTLGSIIQNSVTLVGGCIVALIYGWKLALICIACVPILVGAGFAQLYVVELKDQRNKEAYEESAQLASEAAGGIRTVAALTLERNRTDAYRATLAGVIRRGRRPALLGNIAYGFVQGAMFFVSALGFWYGSRLLANLEYTVQEFFTVFVAVIFASQEVGMIFGYSPDMSKAKSGANKVLTLFDTASDIEVASTNGGQVLTDVRGEVGMKDVHFRFPTRPNVRVLRSLNLHVKPGQYAALVGPSGCGKSTTLQLIERFYDPLSGAVTIDGKDLTDLNVHEYRKFNALVSQEPTLYSGTVKFNVLLGSNRPSEEVTQEEIEQACRDANIHDFIVSLPDGYDTQVGGKGASLSGGQKQRVAIARSLMRNPKVLLLDEATSALDSESEKIVQRTLDQNARGRTTVAIAHRLSTIQNADVIFVISEGRVVDRGTHTELLNRKGLYYELVQQQELEKTS